MYLSSRLKTFAAGESGAVTVDWVILTAGLVGLGLATMTVVSAGVEDVSGDTGDALTDFEIASSFAELVDYSGHSLVGPSHNEAWRTGETARFGAMSDTDLMAAYNASYGIATGGVYPHAQHETDRIGVMEQEMAARGMTIPNGNMPYTALHTNQGGTVS